MKKILDLDINLIVKLYRRGVIMKDIVKRVGVSRNTIYLCLRKNKIKYIFHKKYYKILTKKFLEKEYLYHKKSSVVIAKEVGCTKVYILRKLKQYNIPRRKNSDLNKERGPSVRGTNSPFYVERIRTKCSYCGKELLILPCRFNDSERYFCNNSHHMKFRTGNKNSNWRDGMGRFPYSIDFNEELKLEIRKRDNFTCQLCDITEEEHIVVFGKVLCVHHINYNKMSCDKNELITLCNNCNLRVNFNQEHWQEYFTQKIKEIYSRIKS